MSTRLHISVLGFLTATIFLCSINAHAQISIRSGLSDDRITSPGDSYDGVITVVNETTVVQTVSIYQNDYLFYADGTNVYGSPGEEERSNADWIIISGSVLSIPPKESIDIAYRVTVPESTPDFPLSGSYWSIIMVEAAPRTTADDSEAPRQLGLRQKLRYGIQVASHVGESATGSLEIEHSALTQNELGDTALELHVANRGILMLRPQMWVELYDLAGNALGRFDGSQNRIYPDTSVKQKINLGLLQPGKYNVIVVMDAGNDKIFGTELSIDIVEAIEESKDG